MKKMITALLMFGTLTVAAQNSAIVKVKNVHACTNEAVAKVEKTSEASTVNAAQFKAGTLIEVAFMSVKEGKMKQLNGEYFAKVMPIAMEYGLKPLMTVAVKNAYSEKIKPQMVGFFEWPDVAKKEAFEKDPRFLKLKPVRTDALSLLKIGFFEVEKDMTVKLDGSLFYEIYGMDLKEETADQMGKYFEKAGPICSKDYGVDFALSMTPVSVACFDPESNGAYSAQSFGIAIWPSEEANKKFFTSKEYGEIKHFKENAIKTIGAWQGSVIL
ncbi:MAG: hypothetical protein ACHQIM_08315 [Sphingobacteriales bacterium]